MSQKEQHMDRILRIFERCPGTTITALALQSGLARNTVKRLLKEMETGHILEGIRLVTNERELTGREGFFLELTVREEDLEKLKREALADGMFRMITLPGTPKRYLLEGKRQGPVTDLKKKYASLDWVRQVRLQEVESECILKETEDETERG